MTIGVPEALMIFAIVFGVCVCSLLVFLMSVWIKKESARIEKYEYANERDNEVILDLTGDVEYLKGKMDGIENLSKSVLDIVEKITHERGDGNNDNSSNV